MQMTLGGGAMSSVKELQGVQILVHVALLLETLLKSHENFFFSNYHFYQTGRSPGRKGITHNHVDLCYMSD
jgi:hypothetical protein